MFKVGDIVGKKKGYSFDGEVRAVFKTIFGNTRLVVECTVPGVVGCLHIFSPDDLFIRERVGDNPNL